MNDSVKVRGPDGSRGPRVIVGGRLAMTISEATDLHRRLGEALLEVARRYGEVDPRINGWDYD